MFDLEVLKELYEIKISYANVGIEEIQKWRSRPLMEEYAVVFLDATVFPIKRDSVENELIYVAIGITPEGRWEILGYYLPGGMESAYKRCQTYLFYLLPFTINHLLSLMA